MILSAKLHPLRGQMRSTLVWYVFTEAVRFISSMGAFFYIFKSLPTSAYAQFVLLQAYAVLIGLAFTLNSDSAMQKAYSKDHARTYVSISYTALISILIALFLSAYYLLASFFDLNALSIGLFGVSASNIILYGAFQAANSFVLSYFNANKKNVFYFVCAVGQPLSFLALLLFYGADLIVNVVTAYTLSACVCVVTLLSQVRLRMKEIRLSRLIQVFKYITAYSLPSMPAVGSKYLSEYLARLSIAFVSGSELLAAYGFAIKLMSIFRSLETAVFRAVTPFFMTRLKSQQLPDLRALAYLQAVLVAIFVGAFPFWNPILISFFPEKAALLNVAWLYMLLLLVQWLSIAKNYQLLICKRVVSDMRYYLWVSTVVMTTTAMLCWLFPIGLLSFLLILITGTALNYIVVRSRIKKRIDLTS